VISGPPAAGPGLAGPGLPAAHRLAIGARALGMSWRASAGATIATVALAVAAGVATPLAAWLTKLLIDELTTADGSMRRAVLLGLATTLVGGTAVVLGHVTLYVAEFMQRAVSRYAQERLGRRVNEFVGLRFFEDPAYHDRLRLAGRAADMAPNDVLRFVVESVRQTLMLVGFFGALLVIWWPMAVLLTVAAIPAYLAQRTMARRAVATAERVSEVHRRESYFRLLLTERTAAKEIRLFGLSDFFHRRMMTSLDQANAAELAVRRRAAVGQTALATLNVLASGLGVAVVVAGAMRRTISVGEVSLFVAAVGSVQTAFSGLILHYGRVQEALALLRHYEQLLRGAVDLPDGSADARPLRKGIEFRDVWFRYSSSGPWVLRGVDLFIERGRALGIVGVNGAGKSTLIKLLCRLYDPERGSITWDGVDIREFAAAELRRRITAVFQDFAVYEITARENIAIGNLDHADDDSRIRTAAGLAEIDHKIRHLPNGYDTLISLTFSDPGLAATAALSGGEMQRLALARCVLRSAADVLVLDEPSAGLDAAAEYQIHTALKQHRAGRTSLLISHRLSAIRDADVIVVLADGQIMERGSHDELMSAGGTYHELFNIQASGYQDERVPAATRPPGVGPPGGLPPGFPPPDGLPPGFPPPDGLPAEVRRDGSLSRSP
jgi:ATP-binding cassette subfamily B protein